MYTLSSSGLVVAATAAATAAAIMMLPAPAQAAPSCSQWVFPNGFQLTQADGWLVRIPTLGPNVGPGSADYWKPDKNDPSNGTPSGGVQGNKISITIPWSNGSTGTFTGNIEPDGRVTGGTSRFSSNFQTTWISQKMVCADEAIKEGTNQGGPVVAQNAPETWKAINDVDIYDGSGDNAAVVGMLNEDEVVQVAPGCRPDIKCEVIGRGWVFGNHLAKI